MSFTSTERLDKMIFWSLCGYGLTFAISVAAANLFILLGSMLALIRTFIKRPVISVPQSFIRPILLFFGIMLALVLLNNNFGMSLERVADFAKRMVPFILVIAFLREKSQIVKLLLFIIISLMIADVYAIWQGIRGDYRAGSFGGHILDFAGILVQLIPILFVAILDNKWRKYRYYCLFVLTISIIAMVFNGTRIIWIAVSIMLPILLILYKKSSKKVFLYIVVGVTLVGILVSSVSFINTRVASIKDMSNESNSERLLMWQGAWAMFRDHPLIGVGLGQYEHYYLKGYMSPMAKFQYTHAHAHNNFLQMLAETGLVGFTAFSFMFGSFLYYSFRDWKRYRDSSSLMFFAATFGVVVQGLTDFNFDLTKVMRLYFCLMAMYLQYRHLTADRFDNSMGKTL